MNHNGRSSILFKKLFIVSDFFVLNVLLMVYMDIDYVHYSLSHGADLLLLWFIANAAFFFSQVFFSNVVHEPRILPHQILRRVFLLVTMWLVADYFFTEMVLGYVHRETPDVRLPLYFTPILFAGIIASRFLEKWLLQYYRKRGRNVRRVVFVGSGLSLLSIYDTLMGDPAQGFRSNGYFADERYADCPDGLVYRGTLDDLRKTMLDDLRSGTVHELYCCLPDNEGELMRVLMRYCADNVVHFYYVPPISGLFGHSFRQEMVGDMSVFTNYEEPLLQLGNKLVKRAFDVAVSLFALVCMMPLFPFIALIIKRQSPGPIFFKQERTGINGRSFFCYKFRSMHVNNDADRVQATKNDPRKFAFGNFMRKSNIDELPQFYNVLKGDMSVVGPRPHMLHHTEVYRKIVNDYMVRHFVKPGITGWAQVTGFRGETKELWQMEGRIQRDIWYIEHWSIWLDLYIIWRTAKQLVVRDKNAY